MPKPVLQETRFDFRKGLVTSVSPDLLNPDELVATTNARLTGVYGAFKKRNGCQRIHPDAFSEAIMGVTQWDAPSGKQVVVISNGKLYWRNGTSFTPSFQQASTSAVPRTTAALALPAAGSRGWTDPDGTDNGINTLTVALNAASQTVAAASRLTARIGVSAYDDFPDAADDLYTLSFKTTANGSGLSGTYGVVTADVQVEYAINGGAFTTLSTVYRSTAGIGQTNSNTHEAVVQITGSPTRVDFRLQLTVYCDGSGSGNGVGTVQCFDTVYKTDNYSITWVTGAAQFSLTDPAVFQPFRASSAGAPLKLYIASGGNLFEWDGNTTLTQLVSDNPPKATAIISYKTRMFAMTALQRDAGEALAGETPKTIYWSKIGDATYWTTGATSDGGSAVTDFLTGQHLTALEVIGSSLLMATNDSIMRFTGQSSSDIVIAQNTEGVSADVGVIGSRALKRFENGAAFLSRRGPYAASETATLPIGEQVLPSFDALDASNLRNSVLIYHKGMKELLFAVPGASDSGLNKTIYVYSSRLQAWYGPWTYSFGINCMSTYIGASGIENVLAGCSDGYVRLMDTGALDDVLYDGSGGSNITMTVELPVMHFNVPGQTKALHTMQLQAQLPSGHNLAVQTAFDGAALTSGNFVDTTYDGTLRDYRIDFNTQGSRLRVVFTDSSAVQPQVNGFLLEAWNLKR